MADGNRPNRPLRPRQGAPGARRKRRVVIDTAAGRPRPDARQPRERPRETPRAQPVQPTGPVTVPSGVSVSELSQALGVKAGEIIKFLMGLGAMKTMTQSLADEEVELIAGEFKREVTIKHAAEEELEP